VMHILNIKNPKLLTILENSQQNITQKSLRVLTERLKNSDCTDHCSTSGVELAKKKSKILSFAC